MSASLNASNGRHVEHGELSTLRSNTSGLILSPKLHMPAEASAPIAFTKLVDPGTELSGIRFGASAGSYVFPHGDGSMLELYFAADSGDITNMDGTLYGLMPIVPKAAGVIKSMLWRADPLVNAAAACGGQPGVAANSVPTILPAAFVWSTDWTIAKYWTIEAPFIRGPRDSGGDIQATDSADAVPLMLDGLAYPFYEWIPNSGGETDFDYYIAHRFLSGL